jgi:hypothetical protein
MTRVVLFALLIPLSAACSLVRPDSCTRSRHYKQFDWAPRGDDEKTRDPATLPKDVQIAVNRFITSLEYDGVIYRSAAEAFAAWPDPADRGYYPVLAAREERNYLLLEAQNPTAFDANYFLIYSKRLHCIVGYFAWHLQG